jgi:hypothetical protein
MRKLFLITGMMFAFVDLAEAQLASPTLLKPDNGANLPLKKAAKFTWQKVTGATKYRLIFSNDKSFANYDANKFKCLNTKTCFLYSVASPPYIIGASHILLKATGNYFWQVQSVGKIITDNSETGEIRAFSVKKITGYTKIANNGSELSDDAKLGTNLTDWACTQDNKTGLIWEVKTDDGGLRDMNNRYTNYTADYPKCSGSGCENFKGKYGDSTNTDGFVTDVNSQSLCGKKDWRLPTSHELIGLVYCSDGKYNAYGQCTNPDSVNTPTINGTYFPNTNRQTFWSYSPDVDYSATGWCVGFGGYSRYGIKFLYDCGVRLVR